MKKKIIVIIWVLLNICEFNAIAATIPYLQMKGEFGGSSLINLNDFVPSTGDYTLEVTGTTGTAINIVFSGISYIPTISGKIRFVQKNGVVYVFEESTYKTTLIPTPQYTTSGNNLIQNPSFETATLIDGSTDRWIPDFWETWDGGAPTWGAEAGKTNVREDVNYCSDGVKTLIMHSSSRYLMQSLADNSLVSNAYYLLTYDYWTSSGAGNGGANYQIFLGTDRCIDDIQILPGQTTLEPGTAKSSYSILFKTPANVPSTTWFSLYRNVDKVDWIDNFKLIRVTPTTVGITGVTSATYLTGSAFAPDNIMLVGGDYIDMSNTIVNPGFDNSLTGWTTTSGSKISTTAKGSGLITGSQNHAQIWVSSGGVSGNFYQNISGLPNGEYTVSAAIAPSFSGSVKLFANTGTTSITSGNNTYYEAKGVVFDGTLSLGLQLAATGSPTIDFDSFSLKYTGVNAESFLQVLTAKIAKAKSDTIAMHSITGRPGYNNLAQYRTVLAQVTNLPDSTVTSLVAAINLIDGAINEYSSIIAAYAPLKTAINDLTAQLSSSVYPNKIEYNAAITTGQAVYDSQLDQRANIATTISLLEQKRTSLTLYSQLGSAIADANTMVNSTNYAGKIIFISAIAAAQDIYNAPVGKDISATITALRQARGAYYNSQYTIPAVKQTVSWVDTSLKGSEKFVLRINGKPFYMTNIQIRMDKLYGSLAWSDAALEAVVKRAADDGFNTVSIPIHWREVEPIKDEFDWRIVDKYMGWCKKYGIKMELLWFSWSSGGRIQWLVDNSQTTERTLRTPDYVCSVDGKSEFNMLRKEMEYSLDWRDIDLRNRDKYVLSQVMDHIAVWEANNGNPQTVIGVQLGNEARSHYANTATSEEIINYFHTVGAAVKESKYVTWTRLNCVSYETTGRINANESKRNNGGTNIDFVGVDIYGTSASSIKGNMSGYLPHTGKNYSMIMEIDAKDVNTPLYQMAALAGNKAFDYYNMAVVDGNALYLSNGTTLTERAQIGLVRQRNKILNLANEDIALKKHGLGLYVYNYAGNSTATETGIEGISFAPETASTQAIAIRRSPAEIILLSSGGGSFTYPSSLNVLSASKGYFDANNVWVSEGNVSFTTTTLTMPTTSAVRLLLKNSNEIINNVIQNPSFEKGTTITNSAGYVVPTDWTLNATLSGADVQLKDFNAQDGTYRYFIWTNPGSSIDFYQNIALPAGQYTLRAGLSPNTASTTFLYANVNGTNYNAAATGGVWGSWLTVPVSFTVPVDNATVRIGVTATNAVMIDNFLLLRKTDVVNALSSVTKEDTHYKIRNCSGGVLIISENDAKLNQYIDIYSITGILVKRINNDTTNIFIPLSKGIYIIDHQKVVVS